MDIEKLIERLKYYGTTYAIGDNLGKEVDGSDELMLNAATALSTLQAENEKLRSELEQKEKYYEQMVDALAATESADLAQMTACVYYKPGVLCRYGGDDPANVCVLGPCPHERTAEEVLADLARMTAERDAAVKDLNEFLAMDELCPIQCEWCKWNGTYCDGKTPEWRGKKED